MSISWIPIFTHSTWVFQYQCIVHEWSGLENVNLSHLLEPAHLYVLSAFQIMIQFWWTPLAFYLIKTEEPCVHSTHTFSDDVYVLPQGFGGMRYSCSHIKLHLTFLCWLVEKCRKCVQPYSLKPLDLPFLGWGQKGGENNNSPKNGSLTSPLFTVFLFGRRFWLMVCGTAWRLVGRRRYVLPDLCDSDWHGKKAA